jgi:4'-phosphopantetheinyl transferase
LLDGGRVTEDEIAFFTRRLGSSESRRLASFLRPERQRQFLLGRMLLRVAVSDLTGLALDAIGVVERPGNAPALVLPDAREFQPNFSLSHSRNWMACVISRATALGLDIEVNDAARDIYDIGEMVFHPSELRWISSQPDAKRLSAFYDLWCEREALHKFFNNFDCDPASRDEASSIETFSCRPSTLPVPDLTVVVVSDRRLLGIEEKILDGFTGVDRWVRLGS